MALVKLIMPLVTYIMVCALFYANKKIRNLQ